MKIRIRRFENFSLLLDPLTAIHVVIYYIALGSMYLQLTSFPSFFFVNSHFSTPVACSKGSLNPEKQYKSKLDVVGLKAEYVLNNEFIIIYS